MMRDKSSAVTPHADDASSVAHEAPNGQRAGLAGELDYLNLTDPPGRRGKAKASASQNAQRDWRALDLYGDRDNFRIVNITRGGGNLHLVGGGTYKFFDPVGYGTQLSAATQKRNAEIRAEDSSDEEEITHDAPLAEAAVGGEFRAIVADEPYVLWLIQQALPRKKPGMLGRYTYAEEEGWRKMDFRQSPISPGFNCWQGFAYDCNDFGNWLWGAAMCCLGFFEATARSGAHINSLLKHKERDSEADQLAIHQGFAWASANKIEARIYGSELPLPDLLKEEDEERS